MSDKKIVALIYIGTLALILYPILIDINALIISDRYEEFKCYFYTIETGKLNIENGYLVGSSILTTFIPAWIQRITNVDIIILFKLFPQFLFALTPVFVYLMSRKYMDKKYALLAVAFVLTNFYFLYYSEMGRVGVGFAMMAGLTYAVVNHKIKLASLFAILVVMAHYGAAFLAIGILAGVFVLMALFRKWWDMKMLAIPLTVLVIFTGIWNFGVNSRSGSVVNYVVKNTITDESYKESQVALNTLTITEPSLPSLKTNGYWAVERRGVVVQSAFNPDFKNMNEPQILEFILAWIVSITLAVSVLYTLFTRRLPLLHRVMIFGVCSMFMVALVLPLATNYYGIARFYTTATIVTAPCFALLAQRFKPQPFVGMLSVYALLISGVIHYLFGIVK